MTDAAEFQFPMRRCYFVCEYCGSSILEGITFHSKMKLIFFINLKSRILRMRLKIKTWMVVTANYEPHRIGSDEPCETQRPHGCLYVRLPVFRSSGFLFSGCRLVLLLFYSLPHLSLSLSLFLMFFLLFLSSQQESDVYLLVMIGE